MSENVPDYRRQLQRLLTGKAGVREIGNWHARVLEGLPWASIESVKTMAELTDAEVSRLLGISEATLRRGRVASSRLDATTGDRLYRLSKVLALAIQVMESEGAALTWMRRGQPGLGGQVPLDLLVTQAGADEVEALLGRIEHGVYA